MAYVAPSGEPIVKIPQRCLFVCRSASTEWTPVLPFVSGVVTDIGGTLSSLATVAREFGVPLVVGTERATSLIRNGDTVRIDGTEGTVEWNAKLPE
jgi:pyruvate,water dikinase